MPMSSRVAPHPPPMYVAPRTAGGLAGLLAAARPAGAADAPTPAVIGR